MPTPPVALITGGSRGLGLALARALTSRGWRVVVDGRDAARLAAAAATEPSLHTLAGDVTDAAHRQALVDAAASLTRGERGGLDLVVANASDLGPSPLPALAAVPLAAVRAVYETNVVAPLALAQLVLPVLRARGGTWLAISSDAAVEAYPGWGVYGPSKAALDHLTAVLAAEEPAIRAYAVDPGDLRTEMHQRAFPGEDISDRPLPEQVVPAILRLLDARPPSGRYRARAGHSPTGEADATISSITGPGSPSLPADAAGSGADAGEDHAAGGRAGSAVEEGLVR